MAAPDEAFLTYRRAEFPKTHDMKQLLFLLARAAPDLAITLEDIDELAPFGVEIRYPGDVPDLLPGQERDAFALATRARDAVMAELRSFLSTS